MAEHETAWGYARHEGCFTDHRGPSFHPHAHLQSLKATAFSPQKDLLVDECHRYSRSLGSSHFDPQEGEDQQGSLLKKLERQCRAVEELPQVLPRWNAVYDNLAVPTELMDGFDVELDMAEYKEAVRSWRDTDLVRAWLPIFSFDDKKDEGLRFPPAAEKLDRLILHELENEKNSRSPADAKLAQLLAEADMADESLQNILKQPLGRLHEDLFLLPFQDVPSDIGCEGSPGSASVISVVDLTSESNSPTVQRIESTESTTYRLENENQNKMMRQAAHPCQVEDSRPCLPGLAQVMTLPLPSSDSHDEMQMMCDIPQSGNHADADDWDMAEGVVPVDEGINQVSESRSIPEDETAAQDGTNLSSTFEQCSAPLRPGDDRDSEKDRERECTSISGQDWTDHLKRKHGDDPPRPGLEGEHFGTSHLLSQFMAMTGASKRLKHAKSGSAMPSKGSSPRSKTERIEGITVAKTGERLDPEMKVCPKKLLPAVSPEVSPPSESANCLVSLQLGHSVIRHLEEVWPANHLVDRDFCSHTCTGTKRLHDGSVVEQSATFQAAEADVPLTVEDGIIVTTLLQIRQKPLPGSTALTAIRQRVYDVSQKYQRLTILVRESPGARDEMSELSPNELDIYTEFVCFASSLKGSIAVHFIPGGDKTFSRWILSLMIQFAPRLMELDKNTQIGNTTWELFFRQTGMNVRAAQVLSHSLFEELGTSGLGTFLTMSSAEQMLEHGRRLGIEQQVALCFSVLGTTDARTTRPDVEHG